MRVWGGAYPHRASGFAPPAPPPATIAVAGPAVGVEPSRCIHYLGDDGLSRWLDCTELSQDVMLSLHGLDPYDAHTAVWHLSSVNLLGHSIFLTMPYHIRTDRGFTTWLRDGTTLSRALGITHSMPNSSVKSAKSILLVFATGARHVHSDISTAQHAASFNIRVGGSHIRALFDTGATCSCMFASTARRLGLYVATAAEPSITGVGGQARVAGSISTAVKVGKSHHTQTFVVLSKSIAGYDVLLGQDYMRSVGCAVRITPRSCDLDIGLDRDNLAAHISCPIRKSHAVSVSRSATIAVICGVSINLTTLAMSSQVDSRPDKISSLRQFKVLRKDLLLQ
jgi:hypothetical protein